MVIAKEVILRALRKAGQASKEGDTENTIKWLKVARKWRGISERVYNE